MVYDKIRCGMDWNGMGWEYARKLIERIDCTQILSGTRGQREIEYLFEIGRGVRETLSRRN